MISTNLVLVGLLVASAQVASLVLAEPAPKVDSVSLAEPKSWTNNPPEPAAKVGAFAPKLSGKQTSLRANNLEKLRRGLTNYVHHINPAPFFIPSTPPTPQNELAAKTSASSDAGKPAPAGMQAEPATIINDGPSADVLIKGPNRLAQARHMRGPFRWGRRR